MRYVIALVLALVVVTPAVAQQVDIKKPAPAPARERSREPGVIEPGLSREERPVDADNFPPHGGRVPYQPGFVRGLSTKTETGRVGIAAWTGPSAIPTRSPRSSPAATRSAVTATCTSA